MFISHEKHAGQYHNIWKWTKSFETVKQFKCVETTLTNENSIHEELQSKLNSDIECYH